jgi:hypothetical protein
MIYIGIDDTDTLEVQGTNQLARVLVNRLGIGPGGAAIIRHQLLFDPRVPYTSHNGSASIILTGRLAHSPTELVAELRRGMQSWYVEGSDPGLCVATDVPEAVTEFGRRCQREIVTQEEARELAATVAIHLEGLGGTEQGVVGALAAVGLAAGGNDGRVVHLAAWPWPDTLCGPQTIASLHARGIDEVRCADSGQPISQGIVDIGKRLRPNRCEGRVVLYVTPAHDAWPACDYWHALRLP